MDRDMNRDKISMEEGVDSGFKRTAPKPLTTVRIASLKPGETLADGAVRPSSGSLKIRKRKLAHGSVAEWIFNWTRGGKSSRLTIGRYSPTENENCFTLSQARSHAAQLQALISEGQDPLVQREIKRETKRVAEAVAITTLKDARDKTLASVLAAYIQSLRAQGKTDSAADAENMFGNHVLKAFLELAGLPAAAIQPEHVSRILRRLVAPQEGRVKGRTAVKLRSYMSAAFTLALGANVDPMSPSGASDFGLTMNPVAAVPATRMAAAFNRAGKRALSPEELRSFLQYLSCWPQDLPRLILQFQIASGGQRFAQLLRMTDADVDDVLCAMQDRKGRRKQARDHLLPMIPELAEIVEAVRSLYQGHLRDQNSLVFTRDGRPMAPETLSEVVREISKVMVLTGEAKSRFRAGDLRRTVETILGETLRISKDDRAQLLSHGLTGVQDTHYDQGKYLAAKTEALRTWNDYLADLCIAERLPRPPTAGVESRHEEVKVLDF